MTDFTGGSGTDVFIGGESADNASGGGGNDSLIGNGGNDILAGDDGADYLEGGNGDDILFSRGKDPAAFTFINYRAVSDDFGTEVDTLVGGAGDDYFIAGYGDNVDGGAIGSYGNRLYISFRGASSGVTADFRPLQTPGGSVTIGGGVITNIQTIGYLEGSDFDDLLVPIDTYYPTGANVYGRGGNDHIIADYYSGWGGGALYGGDGDDIVDARTAQYGPAIYGDAGNDTLYMGNGFGTAYGGDGNDTIYATLTAYGDAGNDTFYIQSTSYSGQISGGSGDDTFYAATSGNGSLSIAGDDGNDSFIGSDGNDVFTGGAGNDNFSGGGQTAGGYYYYSPNPYNGDVSNYSGNVGDYLVTQDQVTGVVTIADQRAGSPDGTDTLTGVEVLKFANGAYSVTAVLSGQATGVQNFIGTPNADTYYGSEDANTATGYGDSDTFYGFGGNDMLQGNGGSDFLDGGSGDDTLYSRDQTMPFNAPYYGNPWTAPTLDAGTEVDTLVGGAGNDTLFAGYGDNVDGGSDSDSLYISFLGAPSGVVANFTLPTIVVGGGTITGIENVNWVQGSNFDDQITLGGGNGYGAFTPVFGMAGNDTLIAGYYTGYMDGGDDNDVVDGRNSQYLQTVIGGAGDDTLYTNTNTFASAVGGDGNDTIYAHAAIDGGAGNDTIYVQASYYPGQVRGGSGDDTIYTAPSQAHNAIFGDAGNDTLYGGTGADTLDGGDDNDTIDGGTGSNTLLGGNGNDRLILGTGSDGTVVDGGAGTDTLVVNDVVTPAGAINGIEAIEFNSGALTISSAQANGLAATTLISGTGSMTVNQQPNIAVNLSGYTFAVSANVAFTINGSALDDTAQAANAATLLNGGNGNDSLYGGSAGDTLDGGAGVNLLDGGGGNDRLVVATAGSGTSVNGGSGTDTLAVSGTVTLGTLAGLEAIELVGGASLTLSAAQFNAGFYNPIAQVGVASVSGTGSLVINLDPNPVTAALYLTSLSFAGGSSVTLTINGTSGLDAIKGAPGVANIINGGDEADQIRGGSLADTINGGNGNDKLFGWSGADTLTGGAGSDQFRYFFATDSGTGAAADRITDFQIGVDKFNFVIIDADAITPDDQAFAFLGTGAFTSPGTGQIRYQDSGADLLVQVDVDGNGTVDMEVMLQGLAGQALTSGDFML